MISLILQLFCTFFLIGLFTFGGGYAVIGMIQSQIVEAKGWVDQSAFTDIAAISQMTPGPVGLNCSTYVGYAVLREAGAGQGLAMLGSFAASLAVVLPSFLIMLLIVRFYAKFHRSAVFGGVMSGLKPAVAGLIGASAITLTMVMTFDSGGLQIGIITGNFPDWKAWALAGAAFISYLWLNVSPMTLLSGSALAGFVIYYLL